MDIYTIIGFWVTILGTIISVVSLLYAIYISNTAKNIKENLINLHLQKDYKRSKQSILKELTINHEMLKDNNIIMKVEIKERLIDLQVYKKLLSKETLRNLKKLHKLLKKIEKYNTKFIWRYLNEEEIKSQIRDLLYTLIVELKKDFTEKENILGVMIK